MSSHDDLPQSRSWIARFAWWFLLSACLVVAATGIFLYMAARGTDVAMAQRRFYLGMTKWYIVDVHVVFGFLATGLAGVYALVWLVLRAPKAWLGQPQRLKRFACAAIALAAALYLAWNTLKEHPVLVDEVRVTAHPASAAPDQAMLTWSGDPSTTQAVQWRTRGDLGTGAVRYRLAASEGEWQTVAAQTSMLDDPYLANDPLNTRYSAVLHDLTPGTAYTYQAGWGDTWTPPAAFTTAPANATAFSFLYLGDAQVGLDGWGQFVHTAVQRHPEAAFCVLAGDLVNRGWDRGDWDTFFSAASDVFAQRPLVPAIGNHDDCDEAGPWMYLELFTLPENGPKGIEPERAYSFTYANAFFVVLDGNLPPETQTAWLEEQFSQSTATWNFAVFHQPAYSAKSSRDNPEIRDEWCPLFDKYGVDMALQGHDHAYLRTYPMKNGERQENPADGTIYTVTVSGTKYYELSERDYAAVSYEELSTYQIIDIKDRTLTYRAFDADEKVVDEFVIEK